MAPSTTAKPKSSATKKPKATKAKAAAAEVVEQPEFRKLEWKGVTLKLPAEMPESILLDMALIGSTSAPSATFEMLISIIGEGQFRVIRGMVNDPDEDVSLDDVVQLISDIFDFYGSDAGE